MNKKLNTRGFSTQIKKIYVKEDNTLNRFALFLSGLAIALIILLLINFKNILNASHSNASELSSAEAIAEIYDYINSLEGFSKEQRQALDSIIADYFNNCDSVSRDDLSVVYDLINAKYQTNNKEISVIRGDLESKFNSASSSDMEHYSELLQLVDELTNTVSKNQSIEKKDKDDLSQAISNAQSTSLENDEKLRGDISDATTAAEEAHAKIWEAIEILNERTSDHDGQYEFDFGYQNGCYGYYVDGSDFKPF